MDYCGFDWEFGSKADEEAEEAFVGCGLVDCKRAHIVDNSLRSAIFYLWCCKDVCKSVTNVFVKEGKIATADGRTMVGECVLKELEVIKKGLAKKLQPVYLGPYKILKVNYPNLTIQALDNPKRIKTIHVNKTKKYHTNAVLDTNAEIQKSKDAIDKPDDRNQKAHCQYNL
uniref:Uncharacterized protein n=1 Tax=Romanomermis culicivorax TaxID=13658 RepID=A0A915JRD6_ROMCU